MNRLFKVAFLAACSVGGIGIIFFGGLHTEVWHLVRTVVEWSSTIHPALLFGAVAVAVAFPIPAAPLYVYVGATYGIAVVVLGIAFMVLVNVSLGYAMAVWGMDNFIRGVVDWAGYSMPRCPESEHWRFTILVRITPGLPLSIQNYILGLANVPFGKYLAVSWPIAFLIGLGLALTGDGIYEGEMGSFLIGATVILSIYLLGKITSNVVKE